MKVTSAAQQPTQIQDNVNRVSTTVQTKAGNREVLAVVRQTNTQDAGWFFKLFGKKTVQTHRDFLLCLAATPVNVQSALAVANGLIPVASLGGMNQLGDMEPCVERKPVLKIGLAWNEAGKDAATPWLDLNCPLGQNNDLLVNYQSENMYSLGLAYHFDPSSSVTLLAGKGIGPLGKDGILLGLQDASKPAELLELYGKYYPVAFLFADQEWSWTGVWEAGARIGNKKFGFSYSALGNWDFFGSRYKIDFTPGKFSVMMGYSTIKSEPDYSLGVKVNF